MGDSRMIRGLALIAAFAMSSVTFSVLATPAGQQVTIGAVYSVSLSGTDGPSCEEPGPFSDSGTMTITNVSGNNFDATLNFSGDSEDPPSSVSLNFLSGVLDGIVSGCGLGQCPIDSGGDGNIDSISGLISPTSVGLSGNGTDATPSSCTFTFSLSGSAIQAINPETTATAAQTQQADAQSALSPTGVVGQLTRYTSGLIRPRNNAAAQLTANSAHFSSRGLSAGDHLDVPFGVWLAGSYSDSEDDSVAPFKAERVNLTGGIDATFAEDLIVGLSLGVEGSDTRTSANNGQSDTYGFTVAPYLAYLINDTLSVDFAVGYSRLSHDESRGAGRAITGDTNTRRVFAAGNGNWSTTYDNWYLSARAGITWLSSDLDDFTESDGTFVPGSTFRVGQVSVGGEAAYSYNEWEPYVGTTVNHAYTKTRRLFTAGTTAPEDDRTDVLVNAGVRFFGANGMTGGFEYSTLLLRDDYTEHSFQLNFRADF